MISYSVSIDLAPLQTIADNLEAERLQRVVAHHTSAQEDTTAYQDVVNIADKGVFTGVDITIIAYTADDNADVKITIDGVSLSSVYLYFTGVGQNRSVAFNHRFDTSLLIQVKVANNNKCTAMADPAWTVD